MKSILFSVSFILMWLSAFSVFGQKLDNQIQDDSVQVDSIYQRALNNLNTGEFYTAQNQLEQALALDSTHQDANLNLMRIYYAQRKFEEARNIALRLTALNPQREDHWIALADTYKALEDYTGLIRVYNKLIRLNPEESSYYYDKAFTLSLNGQEEGALQLYQSIEDKFGLTDRLFLARNELYRQQKDRKKALSVAKNFVQHKPHTSHSHLMLANTYLDFDKPKDALKTLEGLESEFPNDPYIPLTKADAYQALKDYSKLSDELQKAFVMDSLSMNNKVRTVYNVLQGSNEGKSLKIAADISNVLVDKYPNEALAQAVFGDIALQQGKEDLAYEAFSKAIDLNKKLYIVWEQLLQLEVANNKLLEAQEHGLEAINQFPDNSIILLFTGYAYLLDKKYQEARAFLEESLNKADPKNEALMVQIYSALGDNYHALDMGPASNIAYSEALKIDSNNTYVLNNFAYYLALRKEELTKAASMSKKSNELEPDNASYQDTYAWVLFQQGDYDAALMWIDKAVKSSVDPSATLIEHKGDILFKLGKKQEAVKLWERALKLSETGDNEKLSQKVDTKEYVD
ncbi:tetratricopeptide repeat protein [Albibacterium profundi]|uniref:Tetratricopeptide repeat protein n=1 Tax=Albibacterium profundi TaxID=3134906 RepID=A0ABV5CFL3_9SPHI